MAKKTYSVYLDEDRVTKASGGVVKRAPYEGNFSAYMDDLLAAAVDGGPPSVGNKNDVLVELARHYHPTLVDDLAAVLEKKKFNESRIVARLLEALAEAVKDETFDPRLPLSLHDSKQLDERTDDRMLQAVRELAANLNDQGKLVLSQGMKPKEYPKPKRPKKAKGLPGPAPISSSIEPGTAAVA